MRLHLIGAFAVAAPFLLAACVTPATDQAPASPALRVPARVKEVIDGDTVRAVVDGQELTIRLIGIDTPEKDSPYTELECYGEEASAFTRERLEGERIDIELDVERLDRYDRTLAYVWLGDELVNETIVAQGAAVLLTVPPNVAYVERFERAQRAAREAGLGLWSACP